MFNSARHTSNNILKSVYTLGDVSSRFERESSESQHLKATGDRILVCELTGEQSFITTESLSSMLISEMATRERLVLDFSRVTGSDHATAKLLAGTFDELAGKGKTIIVTGIADKFRFRGKLSDAGVAWRGELISEIETLDQALQICEDTLLQQEFERHGQHRRVSLEDHPLLKGLSGYKLAWLQSRLEPLQFSPGAVICKKGEAATMVYLIERGKVDVLLPVASATSQRSSRGHKVASFCGGAVVGEAAFFDHAPRSADVIAASEVSVFGLDPDRLDGTEDRLAAPIRAQIFQNLAGLAFERLGNINRVMMTLNA
jgi:CRP-like cAMP-binding protein/anti-anti-sigma regulatory factor